MRKVDLHNKSTKFKTVYIQKLPYSEKNMGKDGTESNVGLCYQQQARIPFKEVNLARTLGLCKSQPERFCM